MRKQLIDYIHTHPEHFNMKQWSTHCGTVGCIAGLTCIMVGRPNLSRYDVPALAAQLLDLPRPIAKTLFEPNWWRMWLVHDDFVGAHEPLWAAHPNWRCDLTTIERMKTWARELPYSAQVEPIYDFIGPAEAIRALEALDDHPGYVDWMEAIEG